MIIKTLTLKNFRNHKSISYEFQPGLNILTGPNTVGKTNVVEAIHYLSLGRSFRTTEGSELIQKGNLQAFIEAVCYEGELKRNIRIVISPNSRNIFINGKQAKTIQLYNCMNVLLFEPKNVLMFRGSPKTRRDFLDNGLSKKSISYLETLLKYDKVLKERNNLLKSENINPVLLEINTKMLVELSEKIVKDRIQYVKDINDLLIKITRALTGVNGKLEINYKPFIAPSENFQKDALEAFKRAEERDLRQKATSIGVHREDFSISLNGRDIGQYGSQGENRIVALALKLSPYFLVKDKDKRPVVVLDDVMSELDQAHRLRLVEFVKKLDQVFITATRLEVKGAAHYQIKKE